MTSLKTEQNRAVYYVKQIKLRYLLIGINFPLNIFLYFALQGKPYFYAAAIGGIALLFCRVSRSSAEQAINPPAQTTETELNPETE